MTDIHERITKSEIEIASMKEATSSAHKRLDGYDVEIKGLRDAKHDLYSKVHTHAGIIVGMENAVKTLNNNVKEWADKTDINTREGIKSRTAATVGLVVFGAMGTGFASFVVFVGGKLLNWW